MKSYDGSWKIKFLDSVNKKVYAYPSQQLRHEMNELISLNSRLHGNQASILMYKNQYWVKDTGNTAKNILHKDCRKIFRVWEAKALSLQTEQEQVNNYLRAVINQKVDLQGLCQLIPAPLHSCLSSSWFWGNSPMPAPPPEADVAAFIQENQKYLDMITTRLTYNMLQVGSI